MNIVLYLLTYFFYRTLNKKREKVWNSWTPKVSYLIHCTRNTNTEPSQEQQEYLDTTEDEGNRRVNFRFVY